MIMTPIEWASLSFEEILSYKTVILLKHTGYEMRRQVRPWPRRIFRVNYRPKSRALSQVLDNQIMNNRTGTWNLPIYHEAQIGELSVDNLSMTVDTSYMIIESGDKFLLWQDPDTLEVMTIDSLDSSGVTFTEAVTTVFTKDIRACPVFEAKLLENPVKYRRPESPDTFQMLFLLDDFREMPKILEPDWETLADSSASGFESTSESNAFYSGGSYLFDTYVDTTAEDREDYTSVVLHMGSVQSGGSQQEVKMEAIVSTLDFETGGVWMDSYSEFTAPLYQVTLVGKTKAEAFEIRKFFADCCGRRNIFWMPVFDNKMELSQDISAGDDYLYLTDLLHRYAYWLSTKSQETRKHLYIELKDGTKYYKAVQNLINDPLKGEYVHFTTTFDQDITQDEVKTICWLARCRLDTDEVSLKWRHMDPVFMEASFTVKEVDR